MPEIPIPHVVTSPPFSRTRRKSIARKPMIKPKSTLSTLYLDAPAQIFLKVIVDEDSDDEEYVDEVWSAVVGWELISTPLDVSTDCRAYDEDAYAKVRDCVRFCGE
nr:hypothetical protein [Tanacetum cinerariifolium]